MPLKKKIKKYLLTNNINSFEQLIYHIEELKTTKDLSVDERDMLFKLVFCVCNKKDSLLSFFGENKTTSTGGIKFEDFGTHSITTVNVNSSKEQKDKSNEVRRFIIDDTPISLEDKIKNFRIVELESKNFGKKENNNKIDYSEVDFDIIDLMAKRFNSNKHKYPSGNMLKPIDKRELLFAAYRHLRKMIQPIDGDDESFEVHLASVMCNMQMVYQQVKLEEKEELIKGVCRK